MNKPRVVASIEARMGSSRLPGKILADINGQPTIKRLVNRLRLCKELDDIVVATTVSPDDDVLAEWCESNQVAFFRGSEVDVLQRVVQAHQYMCTDIVVEITGDCPLTDPEIVDIGVKTYLIHQPKVDVVSNCGNTLTWPMGQYVQVFSLKLLEEVNSLIDDPAVHEHVSLYFYEHPERYRLIEIIAPQRWSEPSWRMQLDYPEDLIFQNEVHRHLENEHGSFFGIEPLISLLRSKPHLVEINAHCKEKSTR
jgi:spore coat polysaccharide biosynthesis protein SpsF